MKNKYPKRNKKNKKASVRISIELDIQDAVNGLVLLQGICAFVGGLFDDDKNTKAIDNIQDADFEIAKSDVK